MTDLSRLADMAEILGALVVIGGLIFAILQMRNIRQQRRELAAIELFRFFGNAEFNRAYEKIMKMPNGLSTAEIEARHPDHEHYAMLICTTMENIGVMTFQRIVPYLVVNNLIGSSTGLLWQKLEQWVFDLREELGSPGCVRMVPVAGGATRRESGSEREAGVQGVQVVEAHANRD